MGWNHSVQHLHGMLRALVPWHVVRVARDGTVTARTEKCREFAVYNTKLYNGDSKLPTPSRTFLLLQYKLWVEPDNRSQQKKHNNLSTSV